MAKTPKTMVELIDETGDEEEEEEEIGEDLDSVTSKKSSSLSVQETSQQENHKEESSGGSRDTSDSVVKENGVERNVEDTEAQYHEETFEYESNFEMEIRSTPPNNLPEGVHLFNVSLLHSALDDISLPPMRRKPFKNGTRQSLTFTNDQMWEIERQNRHLMERIFRPTGSSRCSLRQSDFQPNSRTSSAAINRKKRERQIQLDNQVLFKKLQAIKARRPK
ncbi:hypothetical protein DMENIID0001_105040 [Sergentomyia squamirostris]